MRITEPRATSMSEPSEFVHSSTTRITMNNHIVLRPKEGFNRGMRQYQIFEPSSGGMGIRLTTAKIVLISAIDIRR